VELNQAIGNRNLIIRSLAPSIYTSAELLKKTADEVNQVAERLKPHGMRVVLGGRPARGEHGSVRHARAVRTPELRPVGEALGPRGRGPQEGPRGGALRNSPGEDGDTRFRVR
jgi:hypothetical protein